MSVIGGTQVNIGLGIEATAGTEVAATAFPKWMEFSFQAVSEKSMFTAARGRRIETSDSMIRRRYAQGQLAVVPNVDIMPYLFGMALGTVSSQADTPVSGTDTHTITVQNAHASMKTATVLAEQGSTVTERYSNVVCNSLTLEVSDDYAKATMEMIGKFPDTGTVTESYTKETEFAYHQYTAKFGTSLSNAAGNTATPLKSFNLTINNNVQLDEAFLSGSNQPADGGLFAGRLQISGSYSLHFTDTTELDKYKANTKNAMIVEFVGAIITGSTTESIKINLGRVILTSAPKEYNIDGIVVLTQEFTVEYDATDSDISVVIVNDADGSDY